MKPIFFSFKSLNVSWFLALTLFSIFTSYIIIKVRFKDDKDYREKLEDIFFTILISGFIGARVIYVMLNFEVFKQNPMSIIKLSHYNLNVIGGALGGLLALNISSKKHKIKLSKLLYIFSTLFYISMSIGVWNFSSEIILLKSANMGNNDIKIKTMSLVFVLGALIQGVLFRKTKNKYLSYLLLMVTLGVYYMLKLNIIL